MFSRMTLDDRMFYSSSAVNIRKHLEVLLKETANGRKGVKKGKTGLRDEDRQKSLPVEFQRPFPLLVLYFQKCNSF
jgi:hypothetical protein